MNIDISIIVPAIRKHRWEELYNSIFLSTKRNFELILIGPYPLPPALCDKKNIIYIQDYGSPTRASQIGALAASGKFLTWAADDGVFLRGALDRAIDYLENKTNKSIKDVVINNYYEAGNILPEHVLKINTAYGHCSSQYISNDWYIFNVATMYTEYFKSIGGYDCRFEATALAHTDLAARCQRDGAIVGVINEAMLNCTQMPGTVGDHAPVHYAQLENDELLFRALYSNVNSTSRTSIDVENWQKMPPVWERRFNVETKEERIYNE